MLRELKIKNFAIIDSLDIHFEQGLNILTGETGAGKSIIVDALGLLLGDKFSTEFLKNETKETSVEAYFDDSEHPLLQELGIDCEEGIILRRQLTSQGKGRCYINNTSSSLQTLSLVGKSLLNIHGQNQHHDLLTKENHLYFVDSIGGLSQDRSFFSQAFKEVTVLKKNLADLKSKIEQKSQKIELLRYQIKEIDSLNLRVGEKESLEEELVILQNLSKLKEVSEKIHYLLYTSEGSCIDKLSLAIKNAQDIVRINANAKDFLVLLESAYPLLKDAVSILQRIKDKYDVNRDYIDKVIERLDTLKKLESKYRKNVEEILQFRQSAEKELSELETMDEQLDILKEEIKKKEENCLNLAIELSKKRAHIANKIEEKVLSELKELGFSYADFKILINKKEVLDEDGFDNVEFLFSANPGEPLKPLIKIASGGEISRVMLALKSTEISFSEGSWEGRNIPQKKTLLFDEVDAGIGGITAQNVANKLKKISKNHQVICITHLPQIAAIADNHLLIKKTFHDKSIKVTVESLTYEKRQQELARMLSGVVTDTSIKHAKELLNSF